MGQRTFVQCLWRLLHLKKCITIEQIDKFLEKEIITEEEYDFIVNLDYEETK